MKVLLAVIIFGMAWLISACYDLGDESVANLEIQTAAKQYRYTDTLQFRVLNLSKIQCHLTACNLKLTYWLQVFEGRDWRDHSPVNIGPCLAIYAAYIVLPPRQAVTEQLPLANLTSLSLGFYRIRVEYRLPGRRDVLQGYSDIFQITN